jgi:hypothetical protein
MSLLQKRVLSIMVKRSFLACWGTIAGERDKRTYFICMYSFLTVTIIFGVFFFFIFQGDEVWQQSSRSGPVQLVYLAISEF